MVCLSVVEKKFHAIGVNGLQMMQLETNSVKGELKAKSQPFFLWLIILKYHLLVIKKPGKSPSFFRKGLEFVRNPWLFFQFERPPFCVLFSSGYFQKTDTFRHILMSVGTTDTSLFSRNIQ